MSGSDEAGPAQYHFDPENHLDMILAEVLECQGPAVRCPPSLCGPGADLRFRFVVLGCDPEQLSRPSQR